MTILGTLGAHSSDARGINDSGEVVGALSGGINHAFLYRGGTMFDLNNLIDPSSVWTIEAANAINDSGQIVGFGPDRPAGGIHALLLTPVPEPETYALLLAGLGLMGFMVRRRKQKTA
jgi:probable HAF family extracellular repeat protein